MNELRITYGKKQLEALEKYGIDASAVISDILMEELKKTPDAIITHPSWHYLDKYEIEMRHADNFRSEGIYLGEVCSLEGAQLHLQGYFRAKVGEIKRDHCE